MKRLKRVLAPLFILSLLRSACTAQDQSVTLAVCGSYAVPGLFCSDLKGGTYTCEVLETDSYGRILFSYTTQSVITEKEEKAVVVCQKIDEKYVYFYEDLCYFLGDPTETDIDDLKERNDWEKIPDSNKMSKRENTVSLDLYIATNNKLVYTEVKSACCTALEIRQEEIKELCLIDQSPSNQVLYWLVAERDGATEKYYVMADLSYKVAYMNAPNGMAAPGEIAAFKAANGWSYG